MTFFAGVRPLVPVAPADGLVATPLFASSRDSYTRAVQPAGVREPGAAPRAGTRRCRRGPAPRLLAMSVEGRLPGAAAGAPPMRAVIVGDADFASNSFLPYLANGDLALAAVRWLAREERSTAVASRIPVPPMILLTGAQMRGIFLDRRGAAPVRARSRWGRVVVVARAVSRALPGLAAFAAIGYLVAMVITGALPQQRQRVQFEAKGVLQLAPERIARVELARGADRAVLVRGPGAGMDAGGRRAAPRAARREAVARGAVHAHRRPGARARGGGARRRRAARVRPRPAGALDRAARRFGCR